MCFIQTELKVRLENNDWAVSLNAGGAGAIPAFFEHFRRSRGRAREKLSRLGAFPVRTSPEPLCSALPYFFL
jgi:hypothetical protein